MAVKRCLCVVGVRGRRTAWQRIVQIATDCTDDFWCDASLVIFKRLVEDGTAQRLAGMVDCHWESGKQGKCGLTMMRALHKELNNPV